jgi:hypothetical protein
MRRQEHWLARPATIRLVWRAFVAVLVLTVAAQLWIAIDGHFAVERLFGFHALYGLLACAAMIAVAKAIGAVLKRRDTYYDDER